MRSSWTEKPGSGNCGSANAPAGIATEPSEPSIVSPGVAPHQGRKRGVMCELSSPSRTQVALVPSSVALPASERTCAPDAVGASRAERSLRAG
jgi:hypothetical protein